MRDLLRRWFRIPASSADIAEEFESHLAHKRRALEAEGLPPDEAERRARLALGNRSAWIEETRGAGGFPAIESVFRDLRYAARLLNKERVFSLIVVVSLALGIGANTAIFSLLNALLFRPLPVPAPEQLARLYFTNLPKGTRSWVNGREVQPTEMGHFNYAFYEALRRKPELTAGVFGHAGLGTMAMEHDGVPSQIVANFVTGTYLPVLGAAPLAGRLLNPEDDQPGQAAIVISERLWERVFQRRPGIVGAQVTVERVPFTIAGVMPRSFHGVQPGIGIEAWIPYAAMERMFPDFAWRSNRSIANLRLFVRTRPGAALEAHSRRVLEESVDPASNAEGREGYLAMRLHAQPIPTGLSSVTENYSGALWTLFGAVAAVLLISASNVTSLMAARAMRRARELAVRRALGASGWRIGRQLLLESLLLGAGGGALGFAVAQGIGDGVRAGLFGGERMFALDVSTDWRVALYISTMLVAVVLIAGLAPSWLAARTSIQTRGVTPAGLRLRSALIVGQTAIAFALLGGAALMAASVQALFQEPTGYDSARTLLLTPDLYNAGVERPAHRRAYENILRAVRASGRFESSGLLTTVPLIGALGMSSVEVPGKMDLPPRERMMIRQTVSDGYFSAMGIGLLAGSDFQPLGGPTAVCVISENAARLLFGGVQQAIGQKLRFNGPDWLEVAGVAANTKFQSGRGDPPPAIYLSVWHRPIRPSLTLAVRYTSDQATALREASAIFDAEAGRRVRVEHRTLSGNFLADVRVDRLLAATLSGLGLFALLIVITGIVGIIGYMVEQRRREIGVRLAVGAAPADIRALFTRYGLRLLLLGTAVGGALCFSLHRMIESYLYRVEVGDPRIWAALAACLMVAGFLAALIPAWRASRISPAESLRAD